MDPFVVETINWWKKNIIDLKNTEEKMIASVLLKNIGIALLNSRDTSNDFHYDSGFVHSYRDKSNPIITFEVHPPRRCFRLIENFDKIISTIKKMKLTNKNLQPGLAKKYDVENINLNFSSPTLIATQVISQIHNKIPKNQEKASNLFLTPFLAEKICSDANTFRLNLNYIVDTYRTVDYWNPDKKK